jgi:hypothetical protein
MDNAGALTDISLEYVIDAADRIHAVDARWYATAAANGAPELTPAAVVGRPLGDFIADRATRHLSQVLLARARATGDLSFPFRCDAPGLRREMRIELSPEAGGYVRCRTTLLDARAVPSLPVAMATTEDGYLTMCSWCNRILLGARWGDPDAVVDRAQLFLARLPEISHTICPDCAKQLEVSIEPAPHEPA